MDRRSGAAASAGGQCKAAARPSRPTWAAPIDLCCIACPSARSRSPIRGTASRNEAHPGPSRPRLLPCPLGPPARSPQLSTSRTFPARRPSPLPTPPPLLPPTRCRRAPAALRRRRLCAARSRSLRLRHLPQSQNCRRNPWLHPRRRPLAQQQLPQRPAPARRRGRPAGWGPSRRRRQHPQQQRRQRQRLPPPGPSCTSCRACARRRQ